MPFHCHYVLFPSKADFPPFFYTIPEKSVNLVSQGTEKKHVLCVLYLYLESTR